MSTNEINTDALIAIAKGEKVHHAALAKLVRQGMVTADGYPTAEGQAIVDEAFGMPSAAELADEAEALAEGDEADAELADLIEAEDAGVVPVKPKRSRKPRSCGCGCGDLTNGGLWKPGHDARWAGNTGRTVAAELGYMEDNGEIGEHVALRAPEGTNAALIVKATNVALAAMGKAQAKAAKVSA